MRNAIAAAVRVADIVEIRADCLVDPGNMALAEIFFGEEALAAQRRPEGDQTRRR